MANIALIPARSGSTRIINKNMKMFANKPLIQWTFEAAKESTQLDEIFLSTDSHEIANLALELEIQVPFIRPKYLAQSHAKMQDVIEHFIEQIACNLNQSRDNLVLLQPTSPLRTSLDIDGAVSLFLENENVGSLLTYSTLPASLNPRKIMFQDKDGLLDKSRSEEWNSVVEEFGDKENFCIRNGPAIYISGIQHAKNQYLGGKTLMYEMPWMRSIDIDTQEDFEIAEAIMKAKLT
jgi:CMP-N,N'-diacetyllegionaminic acid synthase